MEPPAAVQQIVVIIHSTTKKVVPAQNTIIRMIMRQDTIQSIIISERKIRKSFCDFVTEGFFYLQ